LLQQQHHHLHVPGEIGRFGQHFDMHQSLQRNGRARIPHDSINDGYIVVHGQIFKADRTGTVVVLWLVLLTSMMATTFRQTFIV
jgi:hypothetical protein